MYDYIDSHCIMHIATYIISFVCICLSVYNLYCSWHFHQKPDIGLFPRTVLMLQSTTYSTYKRTFKLFVSLISRLHTWRVNTLLLFTSIDILCNFTVIILLCKKYVSCVHLIFWFNFEIYRHPIDLTKCIIIL